MTTPEIPASFMPIPKIFDVTFKDLYYDKDTKTLFVKRRAYKTQSVRKFREVRWNEIHPSYTDKDGKEHFYTYRFALVPYGNKQHVRVKESDLEAILKTQEPQVSTP
jgi:hypothetical protein